MTPDQSWGVEGLTLAVLHQIESSGYAVSVHRLGGSLHGTLPPSIEMHAVRLDATEPPQIARVVIESVDDPEYHCACLLAHAVGIDLEDG